MTERVGGGVASMVAATVWLAACATNPVTGRSEVTLMSEAQEIALGRQLDAEVRRELGVYDDAELQRYVEQIGLRLAALSHRPQLPWHVAIVDQPAVNAFALPGGYIYLTRGILPFLDNEAELAGVLGHEIGHVTARHAARQYTKQLETGLALGVLSVFVPAVRPYQDLANLAFGLLFLKHSRDDELEADRLGAEYTVKGGWDPRGVAGVLTTLSRLDEAASSRRGVPGWLSTHPDPTDRVVRIQPVVQQALAGAGDTRLRVERDPFLERLDGLVFGDRPEEGVVRGETFLHAALRFRLDFPAGWEVTNTARQVVAQQPGREVYLVLQLVDNPRGELDEVAIASMRQAGFRFVRGERGDVGGLPAFLGLYRGRVSGIGDAQARAAHIAYDRNVFWLVGVAPAAEFPRVEGDLVQSLRSFRPLTREEAARIRPNRVAFYVVRPGDTWQSIAARAGEGNVKASTLAIMNHAPVNEQPQPGARIKIVVGG
jgi:predicted Zn-dependent protease